MNHIENIKKLRNRYYLARHGKSMANTQGIIVSNPEIGTVSYGLVEEGKQQVVRSMVGLSVNVSTALICTSDFLRTRQTAEIIQHTLNVADVLVDQRLRERFFGEWDMGSDNAYAQVWADDKRDPAHTIEDVESVLDVLERMTAFVADVERQHDNRDIIIVSHGDPLQILRAAFADKLPPRHQEIEHVKLGEIVLQ